MGGNDPEEKKRKNVVVIEDVDISLAAKVVRHGGRFYLTVRPADIEFWNIRPRCGSRAD